MPVFQCQCREVGHDLVEEARIAPAEIGAIRLFAVHGKIEETSNAGFGFEEILAGCGAPHGRYLVDGLANADTDILTAFMPASPLAHDLPPNRKHTVLPQIIGEPHVQFATRVIAVQGDVGGHQGLEGAVVEVDVIGREPVTANEVHQIGHPFSQFFA